MSLTPEQRAFLDSVTVSEVRLHYGQAELHDYRATVSTLGHGGMLRRDVAKWLEEKEREAEAKADRIAAENRHLQARTLFWAQAAFWGTVAGIVVAIGLAFVGK